MKLYDFAVKYHNAGISVIPTNVETKAPKTGSWKNYQIRLPSESDIEISFAGANGSTGLAIICGRVSGNLEVIDIDNKIPSIEKIYNELCSLINEYDKNLLPKLVIETTQSGGYHIAYRCETPISGNKKLAQIKKENGEVVTIIETRGEGGYVIVAPSKGYQPIQGDFASLQTITTEERNFLLNAAKSFNKIEDESENKTNHNSAEPSTSIRPGDDFNLRGDVFDVLEKHEWTVSGRADGVSYFRRPGKDKGGLSATYNHVPNKFYVFSTNAHPFEAGRAYDNFSVYALLEHHGDFKEAALTLSKQGYGEKIHLKNGTAAQKPINEDDDENDEEFPFWEIKKDSKGIDKLIISKDKLLEFLCQNGFGKYRIDDKVNVLVRVKDHIVTEEDAESIGDFVLNFIKESPQADMNFDFAKKQLTESYLQQIEKYLAPKYLSLLKQLHLNFIKDKQDSAFFFFKNTIAKVTKKGIETIDYATLGENECIWKEQIIDRDFKLLDEKKAAQSHFAGFLRKVCSPADPTEPNNRKKRKPDNQRLMSLMCAIGYLQHTYQNPAITKAVILCEEKIAKEDESNGRTGKGLTAKALALTRKRVLFNGKQLDFTNRFLFQTVSPDTQLIVFDDVRKNFDFENLFSILTEGLTVEPKHQKPFHIPFKDLPKILITTNNVLANDMDSHRARKFEIEYSDYFSADYTPVDEFGELFFEWEQDSEEWDKFFNFMLVCCKYYFVYGLADYPKMNLSARKLAARVPEEFLEFAEDQLQMMLAGKKIFKDDLCKDFAEEYRIFGPGAKRAVSQKSTSRWFKEFLAFKNIDYVEDKETTRDSRKKYFAIENSQQV